MSPAVSITAMICLTIIIVSLIGSSNNAVKQTNKKGDNNIDGSRDQD